MIYESKCGEIPCKNNSVIVSPPVPVQPKVPVRFPSKYDAAPVWTDEPETPITPFTTTLESNPLDRIVATVRNTLARLGPHTDEQTLWSASQDFRHVASELRRFAREAADREQHGDEQ